MSALSADHRRVIRLSRIEGLPIKDVAKEMDRSPNATSVLLFRALLKLKEAFGDTESLHLPRADLILERSRSRIGYRRGVPEDVGKGVNY